jgi:hypothetical protein
LHGNTLRLGSRGVFVSALGAIIAPSPPEAALQRKFSAGLAGTRFPAFDQRYFKADECGCRPGFHGLAPTCRVI